jgi:valyl-tRNA synthetase
MELSKHYNPSEIEANWSAHWKEKGYFKSLPDDREAFTVVIPPPNVTGVLHMGHTLNETVQDILVRRARMLGKNACWVPGSDHSSIATEAKVVEMLKKKGIEKKELSREEFLHYAFEWKDKYGGIIYNQIEKLGCSVDWDRVNFTMDDHFHKAVIRVFIELYEKGLIYRGARMINWDPSAGTALSDEEVEYREVSGKLYYIKYRAAGEKANDEHIIIATQRPETIMGDVAVCVNPHDERYASWKGKKVIVPLVDREVPVIFDDYVDAEFGTGVLKITPAHDINDYNIGLKYNLPVIDTLNEDGTLNESARVFVGMDRFEAREAVIARLRELGLLFKEEPYQTRLGFSQRTHAVVEPRISTQWFLKMKELAGPALKAVLNGNIKIHPGDRFLNTYKNWLENVEDWCISRQLWWGLQIPAWYDKQGNLYVAETREDACQLATESGAPSGDLLQDEDVLDTWFSSWLWPIEVFRGITMPGNRDFKYYYPTSVLVTGQDIIFFWVARMIMAGYEFEKTRPFNHVYFTGMVRDKQGRKMSKSLGNSPDLLDLIDKYGADAVRFGIMISSPAGNDLLFDEASLEQGRNFNNKLWNALKLVRGWESRVASTPEDKYEFAVNWFDNRLNEVVIQLEGLYEDFKLSEALKTIYSLIWDDFCSWYLEWVKPEFEKPMDAAIFHKTVGFFERLLQLLHPFMPFISEEIYHRLRDRQDDLCVKLLSPAGRTNESIANRGFLLKQAITAIRDVRKKNQMKQKDRIQLHILTSSREDYLPFEKILERQAGASAISYQAEPTGSSITVVCGKDKFILETGRTIDSTGQKEELIREIHYLKGFLQSVDKKLGNDRFVRNARTEIIELEKKKKADAETKIKVLQESLDSL